MRSARTTVASDGFLGVRLTNEDLRRLDELVQERRAANRSEVIRELVREASETSEAPVELPTSVRAVLDELVNDGWAHDLGGALGLVTTLGLGELSRLHAERLPALRRAARDHAERRAGRRRVEHEGGGLLER